MRWKVGGLILVLAICKAFAEPEPYKVPGSSVKECHDGLVRCQTGLCIPEKWWCDGDLDCPDGDDEETCENSEGQRPPRPIFPSAVKPAGDLFDFEECTYDEFECDSRCIPQSLVCDGQIDCGDGRDEGPSCEHISYGFPVDPPKEEPAIPTFKQVFPPIYNGDTTTIRCPSGQYSCSGRCVPGFQYRCDGKQDCLEGSDEFGCIPTQPTSTTPTTTTTTTTPRYVCPFNSFSCGTDKQCYPESERCNGIRFCSNGADEHACPQRDGCVDDSYICKDGFCYLRYLTDCQWKFKCRGVYSEPCGTYHRKVKYLRCTEKCFGSLLPYCPEPTTTTTTTTTTTPPPPPRWLYSCDEEYFSLGDKCIQILKSSTFTWSEARDFCRRDSAWLLEIDSGNFFIELTALLNDTEYSSSTYYVGASDIAREGSWLWEHSKRPVTLGTPFWGLELTMGGGNLEETKFVQHPLGGRLKNCGYLENCPEQYLTDGRCEEKRAVICEKRMKSVILPREYN